MRDLYKALVSLYPGTKWIMNGDLYEGLDWSSDNEIPKPSLEVLEAECDRLEQVWLDQQYRRDREKEYPDFRDYLDGVVKGDQAQIQAYIDACLAVKDKYPKP